MELALIIVFLLLSGFFSGSETAYLSFDNFMVEIWRKQKRSGYRIVQKYVEQPERYLSLTLVGTNVANISYSSIATIYLLNKGVATEAVFVILPLTVLLVGEIIPKVLFMQLANRVVLYISPLLVFFQVVMFPVIRISQWFGVQISRILGVEVEQKVHFFTVPDLDALVHEAEAIGVVDRQKRDLIHRTLALHQRRVFEIMTPRTEIVGVDAESEMSEARKLIIESGYSKLPVYEKDMDHVLGIISARDFFDIRAPLVDCVRPAKVVPESISLFALLREMRRESRDFALVVDEYGGTAGLVTLEDVLEELVGSIEDEYDREEKSFRQIVTGTILASGRAEVDQVNHELGYWIPSGDYTTVAGWILERLGRIPKTGDVEDIDDYTVKILRAGRNRIYAVLIRRESDSAGHETEKRT
jgi:putative hemolysin